MLLLTACEWVVKDATGAALGRAAATLWCTGSAGTAAMGAAAAAAADSVCTGSIDWLLAWLKCLEPGTCLQVMTCQQMVRTLHVRRAAASVLCSATSAVSIRPHCYTATEFKLLKLLAKLM